MRPYIETRNKRVENGTTSHQKRAFMISKIKEGWPTWKVVEELEVNERTVYRWRRRIKEGKL
jgi:transposase-like protein